MPIAAMVDNPEGSQELYDKVLEHLALEESLRAGSFMWPGRAQAVAGV